MPSSGLCNSWTLFISMVRMMQKCWHSLCLPTPHSKQILLQWRRVSEVICIMPYWKAVISDHVRRKQGACIYAHLHMCMVPHQLFPSELRVYSLNEFWGFRWHSFHNTAFLCFSCHPCCFKQIVAIWWSYLEFPSQELRKRSLGELMHYCCVTSSRSIMNTLVGNRVQSCLSALPAFLPYFHFQSILLLTIQLTEWGEHLIPCQVIFFKYYYMY